MEQIFILDDDTLTLTGLRTVLAKSGYQVDAFSSIEQIPQPWPVARWSCIICDYYIYDRVGTEVLKMVRDSGDDTPFIFLTGNDDLRTVIDSIQAGASDYLLKPFDPRALQVCIERNIRTSREHRVLLELQKEKDAVEAEKRQIVNWRLMYAAKETRQTEMMIRQLSRSINRSGGYGWLDLIRDDLVQLPDGRVSLSRDILDIVLGITADQKRILEYLDFMSRIDTIRFELQPVAVTDLLGQVLEILQSGLMELARKNGRELRLSLQSADLAGRVMVDKTYFRSIVWELVLNAIKYSPEGSEIILYPRLTGPAGRQALELVVANDAAPTPLRNEKGEVLLGIPYEYSEQVFDMFYSLDPAGHTIDGEEWRDGSGLYIARKLMKRMGGWIRAGNGSDQTQGQPRVVVNVVVELPLVP
jgi:FixJ family two-component response regulator